MAEPILCDMPARQPPGIRGALAARHVCARVARELREARLRLGLRQDDVAAAAGISGPQLGRLERNEIRAPTLEQIWRVAAVLGLDPSLGLFPSGVPIRDKGHLALLARFESRLAPPLRARREVPLPIPGDRRAWDLRIDGGDQPFAAEGETHLYDMQALTRGLELKVRDDPAVDRVVLVVAGSAHNRAVLRAHREALRTLMPLDGGAILRAIAAGRAPPAGGVVML